MIKLCRPYRAKTKGKVERFNGYLRRSFYVPLVAQLKQAGLTLDAVTANAQVRRAHSQSWLQRPSRGQWSSLSALQQQRRCNTRWRCTSVCWIRSLKNGRWPHESPTRKNADAV